MKKSFSKIIVNIIIFCTLFLVLDFSLTFGEYCYFAYSLKQSERKNKDSLPTNNKLDFYYTLRLLDFKKYILKDELNFFLMTGHI